MSTTVRLAPRAIWLRAVDAATTAGIGDGLVVSIQQHAALVARLARDLAPAVDVDPNDAFAAGLLHDVGELLLFAEHRALYVAVGACPPTHHSQLRSEKSAFGIDHALRGANHLLDHRVPHAIADAVADHHDPFRTSDAATIVVAAADEIADRDPGRHHALDLLGVTPATATMMFLAAGGSRGPEPAVDPSPQHRLATPAQ